MMVLSREGELGDEERQESSRPRQFHYPVSLSACQFLNPVYSLVNAEPADKQEVRKGPSKKVPCLSRWSEIATNALLGKESRKKIQGFLPLTKRPAACQEIPGF
jgi:hypothetical protein